VVLDDQPVRRYKPNDPIALNRLIQLSDLRPDEELLNVIEKKGIITLVEIRQAVHLKEEEVIHQANALLDGEKLLNLSGDALALETRLMARSSYVATRENALQILRDYHQENPTRRGIMPEELKNRLGVRQQDFYALPQLWLHEHSLVQDGQWLRLPDHQISFTPAQKVKVEQLIGKFDHSPFLPPSTTEARELVGDSLLNALLETGELVRINSDVLFRPSAVAAMTEYILQRGSEVAPFTVAEFRDHFQTSRKYSLAFLEYLDELGATRREGEGRVVVDPAKLRKSLMPQKPYVNAK
jgi:selenocysteine-specific elongation factor